VVTVVVEEDTTKVDTEEAVGVIVEEDTVAVEEDTAEVDTTKAVDTAEVTLVCVKLIILFCKKN